MNKLKFLRLLVIGLLISNLALVGVLIAGGHKQRDRKQIVIERLHFNQNQIIQFDGLVEDHRQAIRQADQVLKDLKTKLYLTLNDNTRDEIRDSLLQQINKQQLTIESIHYNHFKQVKGICTTEQLPYFKEFTRDLATFLGPPPPKPGKHDEE